MRLIDADKLQQDLIDQIDWLRKQDYELYCAIGDDITWCIDKQPTAYDVDKVVEQLEEAKSMVQVNRVLDDITKDKPKELGQLIAYDKSIEIVKASGMNNNSKISD